MPMRMCGLPGRRAGVFMTCGMLACGYWPWTTAQRKPNIVIIVTDGQTSLTLQYMEHTRKRLVEQGTSFGNFFINDPICCPSRVTILLGQYRHNHQLESHPTGCAHRFYTEGMHRHALEKRVRDAGYGPALSGST